MSKAMEVTNNTFENEVLNASKPVLVDFWAPWCSPCRILGPVIDELAEDYAGKISVTKVNIDDEEELASRYGIMSIPTVVLFKNGKAEYRVLGVHPKADLAQMLDKIL